MGRRGEYVGEIKRNYFKFVAMPRWLNILFCTRLKLQPNPLRATNDDFIGQLKAAVRVFMVTLK